MKHRTISFAVAAFLASSSALAAGHDARVRAWIVDPRGDVDGVVLSDHATIRFDHMTAASVTTHVRVGDRVQITPDGQTLFLPRANWSVDLGFGSLGTGGGPSRALPPLSRSDRAADGMTVSGGPGRGVQHYDVRGVVNSVTYTRGHVADGFVLDGGITVRVPVSHAESLASIRPGTRVSVEGDGVRGRHGVGLRATRVVDASGHVILESER